MSYIKPGDCVKHIIGGPTIFVESIENEIALCTWLETNNVIRQGRFPLSSLREKAEMNIDLNEWS
ncbi:hypothetical protein [Acinetobacter courvalinii]|uniref:hypothetical protein n=1 Tax=Acinetobacter courvalinii TaxID=280147 RepID=UPI0002CFBEA2|nr:hypothetical protein [Acinetobacter courvalinii]ENX06531.1 hypothetical protein F898_03482 [Acinetobacter courvalinii]